MSFKNTLLWLCGYRKYKFTLFNGREVTFRTKRRGQAIQKALNLERNIRRKLELNMAFMRDFGFLNFKNSKSAPDILIRAVLEKRSTNPDRPASIAG